MYTPSKSICEPFILNKEHILRILEIIEKRRPSGDSSYYDPIFTYKRLDDYSHETNDVNVLLHEDNCGRTRIVHLEIHSRNFLVAQSSLNYKITFTSFEDKDENDFGFAFFKSIEIEIEGEDRDTAELLFNELDKYIENAVVAAKNKWVLKLLKVIETPYLMLVVPILALLPMINELFSSDEAELSKIIDQALLSDDVQTKLDAILLHCQRANAPNAFAGISNVSMACVVLVGLLFLFGGRLLPKLHSLYPFVFDFGISAQNYQSRVRVLKWFVGVIGSLVLGVLGNYIYAFLSQLLS